MSLAQFTPMRFDPQTGKIGCTPNNAEQYRHATCDAVWYYNPWYGNARHESDVESDPTGWGIHVDSEPVFTHD